jgi:predicted SnoaL-like aldol condensation-catalyzing enzyme
MSRGYAVGAGDVRYYKSVSHSREYPMSDHIDPKALVLRYWETVWNARQIDQVERFIAPSYVGHELHASATYGPAGMCQVADTFWGNFPDATFTILAALSDGELVALHMRLQATHRPSGRSIGIIGMGLYRVVDGQIAESWSHMDELGLRQQLGGRVVFKPAPES